MTRQVLANQVAVKVGAEGLLHFFFFGSVEPMNVRTWNRGTTLLVLLWAASLRASGLLTPAPHPPRTQYSRGINGLAHEEGGPGARALSTHLLFERLCILCNTQVYTKIAPSASVSARTFGI